MMSDANEYESSRGKSYAPSLNRPGKSESSSEGPLIPSDEGNNAHIYTGMEREKDDREIWGPG